MIAFRVGVSSLALVIATLAADDAVAQSGSSVTSAPTISGQVARAGETITAQEQDAARQPEEQDGLAEIVVTAQRRSENAQRVPIAISTLDPDLASNLAIANPETLGQLLPSVTFNRQGAGITPYIRGVGTASAGAGNEPSVAIFIDDVYSVSGQAAVFDFNSVDSITVLKGPQGTLFGRNATGGVVQIGTRDPTQDPEMNLDLTYANYDKITAAGYASAGITEGLAANIAAYGIKQYDGWGRNVTNGREVFVTESYGARTKLLASIGADTTVRLIGYFDYRKSDQGGFTQNNVDGTFGTGGYSGRALGTGFYDAVVDFPQQYRTKSYGASVKVEHDLGFATIRSITAYGYYRSDAETDLEGSPLPFVNSRFFSKQSTVTQEVQLLSNSNSAFTWIVGAFYLHDIADFHIASTGLAFGTNTSTGDGQQTTNSYSGFGQATVEVAPRLKATLGLRYTSDHRDYFARGTLFPTAGGTVRVGGPFTDDATFSKLSGRASLDYQFTDDVLGYAAFSRGFKSGLFNIAAVTGAAVSAPPPAAPEVLDAYTLGFKSEFADRKVRLNAEAFYYKYSNIQVTTLVAGASSITNAGAATIKGFDIDLTVRPVRALTLTAAVSVADGEYTSFPNGPQFFPLPPNAPIAIPAGCAATVPTYPTGAGTLAQRACNLSGNKTVQTVPFSSTLTATYSIPSSVGDFDVNGSWSHGGNYFFDPDNNPAVRQPKTDIFNTSLSFQPGNSNFQFVIWGNNITGERYYNNVNQSTLGTTKYSPAAPATYGITVKAKL